MECPVYETKLHVIEKLYSDETGNMEYFISITNVHYELEWYYLLSSHLRGNYTCLK